MQPPNGAGAGGLRQRPSRLGPAGLEPDWPTEALDEEPEFRLPGEPKETIEAVAWLKAIREAGHSADWRSGLQQIYGTFAAETSGGIPKAVIHILANAPHNLGEMIRETADRAVPYSEPQRSPTQGGGAARPVAARHKELLPLPWSPEAGEALVPPTGRRNKPIYVQTRRMWLLLMVLILNFEIVGVARASKRPATLLPEGPASPAQAMALGLLAQAADVYAERGERFPNFKEWRTELKERRVDYSGNLVAPPKMLTLEQVRPGLPSAGFAASVSPLPYCSAPVREFLVDPTQLLRAPDEGAPAVTRIWAEPEEQQRIGDALLELGMLEELPNLSDTPVSACGRKISLGSFGVEKAKSAPVIKGNLELCVLRLVINGVPLNACLIPLLLDCLQLGTAQQAGSFRLLGRRGWLISIADRSAFFYLFYLGGSGLAFSGVASRAAAGNH